MTSTTASLIHHVRSELARAIVGQTEPIDHCILTLLCGGHALIEGVPGIAKTLTIKALSAILQLDFKRVQCTADLMPADVMGVNVFTLATSTFALHRGPIFTDLLLVDEINRTPPRTQAALLEAMEERQVTIDGTTHRLSKHFTTFATQNPIEFEGTYPLPEAQLDRFLVKIRMGYPEAGHEAEMLSRHHQGFDAHELDRLSFRQLSTDQLEAARLQVSQVKVEPALFTYIVEIVRRTRDWPALTLGASPRAAINLLAASKAFAAMNDRDYLLPDDVKDAVLPVLRHRIVLKPEADLEGLSADQLLTEILGTIEVPK